MDRERHISVAEARAKFASLIEGVLRSGERYVIERRGRAVAALVDLPSLQRIASEAPQSERPAGAMALVGTWGDVPDDQIDALIDDIYAARSRDTGRRVNLTP